MVSKNTGNWLIFLFVLLACYSNVQAQTLPVGPPVLEDYYRRMQLLGEVDSNISFTIRPLTSDALKMQDVFNPDTTDSASHHSHIRTFARGKGEFRVLPITLQTQYNSKRPYGWNDGPMIPARGFQSVISAGVYAKYGPLSIQLRPEMVYAQNWDFPLSGPDISDSYIDLPERFGDRPYKKVYPGQSSIRLTFGPVSFGLSSENLWWGPGIHNSLLMSNSAPGFNHLTLNTNKPIPTAIGSFEAQLIGGRLEGSGFTDKPDDWRYLSALTFSYQPRWVPGLFLGMTRCFQVYSSSLNKARDYFPLFQSFSNKHNASDLISRDQVLSVFARWLWVEQMTEVYFEYGRGDHSANLRDLILQPDHSRAYLLGFNKIMPLRGYDQSIIFGFEITHLEQSVNYFLRTAGSWNTHAPIIHGFTYRGQMLGAGIGPGSNLNSMSISWIKGLNKVGVEIEHYKHTDDFFPTKQLTELRRNTTSWGIGMNSAINVNKIFLNLKLLGMRSVDSFSNSGVRDSISNRIFNLHLHVGVSYNFN